MGLAGIEEGAGKALGEIGLKLGKPARIKRLEIPRHAGEAIEKVAVARRRHHQASLGPGAGIGLAPKLDPALSHVPNNGLCAFFLAIWGEHGAAIGAARIGEGRAAALIDGDGVAAPGERQGLPKAHDTCATDRHRQLHVRHGRRPNRSA